MYICTYTCYFNLELQLMPIDNRVLTEAFK